MSGALVICATLSACGDDAADGEPGTTGNQPATESGGSVRATAPSGDPVYGGELVVGVILESFGLEPTTFVGSTTDGHLSRALYDNLVKYSPEGDVVGWLADSMSSTDQKLWTLQLRPGITFQDGTPLDADAVKVNLERHKDPANKSRQAGNAKNISTVTAIDPLTVEVELSFPWASFDEIMAGDLGLMASPTAIAAGTINTKPVGTGPFTLVEQLPGDRVVVERNENYWREGEPYLDKITFRVMPDDAVRLSSIEAGEINVAQSLDGGLLAHPENEGLQSTAWSRRANTIHMKTSDGPTADVRVRQALARALDYSALNEVVFDGEAMSEYRLIGSTNQFFDPSIEFPAYEPEEAKELIEAYEAENGPLSITFRCYTGDTFIQMSELVSRMWTDAGVDVDVQISDPNTLVTDMLSGNFQVGCLAAGADTVDPDILYYNSLYSTSPSNFSKYSDPEMDAALDAGRTSNNEAERQEAYSTVQRLLARDIPTIEWSKSAKGWLMAPEVQGLVAEPGAEWYPSAVYLTDQ